MLKTVKYDDDYDDIIRQLHQMSGIVLRLLSSNSENCFGKKLVFIKLACPKMCCMVWYTTTNLSVLETFCLVRYSGATFQWSWSKKFENVN